MKFLCNVMHGLKPTFDAVKIHSSFAQFSIMKKNLILLLFFVPFYCISFAQKGFYAGAGADVNLIWITIQNSYGGENYNDALDMGMAEHLDLGYEFPNKMGVQTGVVFTRMGQKYENSHHNGLTKEVTLNYIGIPIQLKYINGGPKMRFFILAGPQFMFLQNAKLAGAYTDVNGKVLAGDIANPEERFEKMDVGLAW